MKDNFLPPLHDLKNLKIECHSSIADYAELLDNLLWLSPHMETLNLLRLSPHLETFSRASDLEESNFEVLSILQTFVLRSHSMIDK